MDDPLFMGHRERLGNLLHDRERFLDRQGTSVDPPGQVLSLDQLHDQKVHFLGMSKLVDRRDVGMVHGRQNPSLALESGKPLGICRELLRQHFDRHLPSELVVPGPIDHSHAALADLTEDLIVGQRAAHERAF